MKIIRNIAIVVMSIIITSCQQELVYNPFDTSENGMARYLSEIKEISYSNNDQIETVSILFSNPKYDKNGKLNFAYNNISGGEANCRYTYSMSEIRTIANCKDGEVIQRRYTLNNNVIISCLETTNLSDYAITYLYSYDSSNKLIEIEIFDDKYNISSNIFIEWDMDNISSVEVQFGAEITSKYTFKYTQKYHCKPSIPFFFTSCYEIGGTYGVDELLSMQNYFGTITSINLPNEVYFNNRISRTFEYEIAKDGSIYHINQMSSDHKKLIRTYSFKWTPK